MLRQSTRVHMREDVGSMRNAIAVIDRFYDSKLTYPLEWDDFISWQSRLPGVERMRLEIAVLEKAFFSPNMADRLSASRQLIEIRNRYAMLCGLPSRSGDDENSNE